MVPRRTLSQAIQPGEFSELEIAFVKGVQTQPAEMTGHSQPDKTTVDSGTLAGAVSPSVDANGQGTVSVTFRLPAELSARLLRVSLDRKLGRKKPFTQQDILAEALIDWLNKSADPL